MTVTTAVPEQWQGQKPGWTEFRGEWEKSGDHMKTLSRNFAVDTRHWVEKDLPHDETGVTGVRTRTARLRGAAGTDRVTTLSS